jgi:hypothetical protein
LHPYAKQWLIETVQYLLEWIPESNQIVSSSSLVKKSLGHDEDKKHVVALEEET